MGLLVVGEVPHGRSGGHHIRPDKEVRACRGGLHSPVVHLDSGAWVFLLRNPEQVRTRIDIHVLPGYCANSGAYVRMCTAVLNFGEDELLALRELQGNRHCTDHASRNGSSNNSDDSLVHVFSEPAGSQFQDATDSERDDVEEYYSADEDEDARCEERLS